MQYWLINERGNGDSGGEAAYFAEGAFANGAMEVEVEEVDLCVEVDRVGEAAEDAGHRRDQWV